MASIAVVDNLIVVARGLHIDCYDYSDHNIINVGSKEASDSICDIIISFDSKYLAVITSTSKELIVYDLPFFKKKKCYILPRSASKIRFSAKNDQILVADKTGDILAYDITKEDNGVKLLGHLSLLLNVLQTNDCKFVISSDRDEKIRVSCYPNTYNIQTYCLGHKEFVNHLELLPHNDKYLTSTSGDGTIKCWNYSTGKLCHSFDTFSDINDERLKENFARVMIEDGIEVNSLPIVHYAITKLDELCSILAVAVHTLNKILIYSLQTDNKTFKHKLQETIITEKFPTDFKFYNLSLFVYNDIDANVVIYKIKYEKPNVALELCDKIRTFVNIDGNANSNLENNNHAIKLLYKRKYDNVQEYQERKKTKIRKSMTCNFQNLMFIKYV